MQINIGGYDENVFYERLGINYLEKELLRTFQFVPYFSTNDKTPNLDGWLELCDQSARKCRKIVPKNRFLVQIKTLNHNYQNTNNQRTQEQQYKYNCDTKVLNSVLTNAILDPVILFFVDWDNEKIFWKYLSTEFCFSSLKTISQKTFTMFFSDFDKLDFSNNVWIEQLIELRKKHQMKFIFLDIDGVLNYRGAKSKLPQGTYFVEDDKVAMLKKLVDSTGVAIVLSSFWRMGWTSEIGAKQKVVFDVDESKDYFMLCAKLNNYGLSFISETPRLPNRNREDALDKII